MILVPKWLNEKEPSRVVEVATARGLWGFVGRFSDGSIKWEDLIENLVVTEGKNYILDIGLGNGTQLTTWYVGCTDGTPSVAAGDTMASHVGWSEVTAYDEASRQTWSSAAASAGSKTNSASVATVTCSTNSTTFGGAFLTSNNTKGGSTGTLYAAGAFTADKTLDDNETLDITATMSV